jgi:hypothetical protein
VLALRGRLVGLPGHFIIGSSHDTSFIGVDVRVASTIRSFKRSLYIELNQPASGETFVGSRGHWPGALALAYQRDSPAQDGHPSRVAIPLDPGANVQPTWAARCSASVSTAVFGSAGN